MNLHLPPVDVTIYKITTVKAEQPMFFYPVNEAQYHERVLLVVQTRLCPPIRGKSAHMSVCLALVRTARARTATHITFFFYKN